MQEMNEAMRRELKEMRMVNEEIRNQKEEVRMEATRGVAAQEPLQKLSVLQWLHSLHLLNVFAKDKDGLTLAHYAAQEGQLEVLQWLCTLPNFQLGEADLCNKLAHLASSRGHLNVLQGCTL